MGNQKCLKLSARFFGPYKIIEKIGEIVYKLELPREAKVHPVFHVSQLKKHVELAKTQSQLPMMNEHGLLAKEPLSILDRRLVKKKGQAITEVLVQWRKTFPKYSTWENFAILQKQFSVPQTHSFHGHCISPFPKTVKRYCSLLGVQQISVLKYIAQIFKKSLEFQPLDHDRAFLPMLTREWSFQNLEDPKAMSFCIFIKTMKNGSSEKIQISDQNPKFQLANIFTENKSLF